MSKSSTNLELFNNWRVDGIPTKSNSAVKEIVCKYQAHKQRKAAKSSEKEGENVS